MKKQFKLGVIGCGEMAQAIVKGVVLSDFLHEKKIVVTDSSDDNIEKLLQYGVRATDDFRYVAENSEYVLIAVKPQQFNGLTEELKGCKPSKIISIVEGVKKSTLKIAFGMSGVKVAKAMPNMPSSIGSGVIAIDMSDFNSSTDDIEFINNVFNCVGTVLSIDESKMDAVTGISVNGPAYTFMFIDSLIDAGVKSGLSKSEAKTLAIQTVWGATELVGREEHSITELIMQACNNGGTVMEAVKVLEDKNFRSIIGDAIGASVKRSKELSDK